jgi:hypothetical protein
MVRAAANRRGLTARSGSFVRHRALAQVQCIQCVCLWGAGTAARELRDKPRGVDAPFERNHPKEVGRTCRCLKAAEDLEGI